MHIERERKKDRAERPQQRWSGAEEEEEEEWSIKIRIRNGWSKEKGLRDVRVRGFSDSVRSQIANCYIFQGRQTRSQII